MWSFRNKRLLDPVDVTVANLMVALGRCQGRQDLYRHQAPQVLETLRRIAIVESTEASNRIEGIVVPPRRLRALMAQATPETRSEGEIAGYRDVLARIHTEPVPLPLAPDAIRALHADMYAYLPSEGGTWKQRDNVIRQVLPDGREVVRFVPLPASETPAAMDELCRHLATVWEGGSVSGPRLGASLRVCLWRRAPLRTGQSECVIARRSSGYGVGRRPTKRRPEPVEGQSRRGHVIASGPPAGAFGPSQ